MSNSQLEQRIKQVDGFANALANEMLLFDERRHILEPLLRDDAVQAALADKFQNTYGAHAYNHLAPLLGKDLVRDLSRLVFDPHPKTASLVNLFRKASDKSIYPILRECFIQIPDHRRQGDPSPIDGLSEEETAQFRAESKAKEREHYAASFDATWKLVSTAVDALDNDPIAVKLKTFRDKYLAHIEMSPLGQDPLPFDITSLGLTYDEIMDFADRYMRVIFEFVLILTGNEYGVEMFSEAHRQRGEDMWKILAGLEKRE